MKCTKVERATHELIQLLLVGNVKETTLSLDSGSGEVANTVVQPGELRPGDRALQKKQQREEELRQEAQLLLNHFSHRTLEALIRCT